MQDLISRQSAIELVRDVCDAIMSGCESWYDPEIENEVYKDTREVDAILKCKKEVRIALRNMPSAQPEIIRCKECRWARDACGGNVECFVDANVPEYHGYDWFCPHGERRTEE